ncbi:unnamed protein product [Symbiodinium natans]|uniref:PDZ domain-containing protein n=1 Tax=Symbiodinium natans TaxID=878477 RepID=A0A812NSP1_9DINO|nr:unnamed protein product [Symbiodinium natans]
MTKHVASKYCDPLQLGTWHLPQVAKARKNTETVSCAAPGLEPGGCPLHGSAEFNEPADFVELQMDSAFPEGKGTAAAAPETFDIFLDRAPGTYFGVDLSSAGKACVVTSVTTDGLIADWNAKCSEESKVQKYDRLYAVNGQTSEKSKEILDLLKSTHNKMVLTFQRAIVSEVKVQRGALNLGMHLKDGPHFLLVLGVEDGVVKDFNKTVPTEQQIQQSDRIIGVDGMEGVGAALLDKVKNAGPEVTLKVLAWRP